MNRATGLRQAWLVAVREIRERSRSRALRASVLVMILVVVGMILVPSLISGSGTKDVGLAGAVPAGLPAAIESQGTAVGMTVRLHHYPGIAAGEAAVRRGEVSVLVADARRLEWRRQADQQLRAVLTGAIQGAAIRDRAAAAGISPGELSALLAPVRVSSVQLGSVPGRSPGDEMAALVMTVLLLMAISTYGGLVLTGVVEEKSSRVVEVLLAHMPPRSLLAGKVAGIGLLGLAQIVVTALAALVTVAIVGTTGIPAVRGSVLAWAIAWFVLGYALYAMLYGALGSLASRAEDAQTAAGPVTMILVASYFVSFIAVGRPDSTLAKVVSLFPPAAPMAMPNRIAMGAAAWWEPVAAAALTLAAIAVLVQFAGRVYTHAILHGGPSLKLRDAWRGTVQPRPGTASQPRPGTASAGKRWQEAVATAAQWAKAGRGKRSSPRTVAALLASGTGLGVLVGLLTRDVIIGVAAGAVLYAGADWLIKARSGPGPGHGRPSPR